MGIAPINRKLFTIHHANNDSIGYRAMGKTALQDGYSSLLNRAQLVKIKNKAMRAGVWYKALRRIDRVLVDLTIKVTDDIRSTLLAKGILFVVTKLEEVLESRMLKSIKTIGRLLAEKLSLIAQKWGNNSAKIWVNDQPFAVFLAVMDWNR
jgi:hypothetical protein